MKMFYDWLNEINTIGEYVLVSIKISDIYVKAIELRVHFEDVQGKKWGCIEIINIEGENILDQHLFKALNKIRSFVKSKC